MHAYRRYLYTKRERYCLAHLLTSPIEGYHYSLRTWHTLLLYIVVPACGMQLNSISCLKMKNHWFWRESAFHIQTEALS